MKHAQPHVALPRAHPPEVGVAWSHKLASPLGELQTHWQGELLVGLELPRAQTQPHAEPAAKCSALPAGAELVLEQLAQDIACWWAHPPPSKSKCGKPLPRFPVVKPAPMGTWRGNWVPARAPWVRLVAATPCPCLFLVTGYWRRRVWADSTKAKQTTCSSLKSCCCSARVSSWGDAGRHHTKSGS